MSADNVEAPKDPPPEFDENWLRASEVGRLVAYGFLRIEDVNNESEVSDEQ